MSTAEGSPVRKSRLTVVETIYHQDADGQPTAVEANYARWLASDEHPFQRRLKVGEEWQRLETGWLEDVSLLVLTNEEGKGLQTIPTDEERVALAARIVEVGTPGSEADWLILPGESLRGRPAAMRQLRFRCRAGTARCVLTLFPE